MKQEDKELLLRYLSMALPYGVKLCVPGYSVPYKLLGIDGDVLHVDLLLFYDEDDDSYFELDCFDIKPYLRPMSSMTEEELTELNCLCYHNISIQDNALCGYICAGELVDVYEFLLRYHFDFMDLIPKGLAIEVTEENNPYKTTEE